MRRTWWLAVADLQQVLQVLQRQLALPHCQQRACHVTDLLVQKPSALHLHSSNEDAQTHTPLKTVSAKPRKHRATPLHNQGTLVSSIPETGTGLKPSMHSC